MTLNARIIMFYCILYHYIDSSVFLGIARREEILYPLAPSKSITAIGLFSKMLQRPYGFEVSGWPCVIELAGSDAVVLAGCDGGSDLSSLSLFPLFHCLSLSP